MRPYGSYARTLGVMKKNKKYIQKQFSKFKSKNMKLTYQILTVLFWISVAFFGIMFFINMGISLEVQGQARDQSAYLYVAAFLGVFIANAIIPGIIWVIRYFVGKNLNNE